MYLKKGNYDNCCRVPNLPASIIWMGTSRKEEEEKNCTILFVVGSQRKEQRKRERERERGGAVDKHLFSSISCNTVYIINLQTRWMIQQPWIATAVTGSQFMQYGNKRKRKIEVC
jgi:hypothetical protein